MLHGPLNVKCVNIVYKIGRPTALGRPSCGREAAKFALSDGLSEKATAAFTRDIQEH
jgi:hypothetical protein